MKVAKVRLTPNGNGQSLSQEAIRLMPASEFRQGVVRAIDQHAAALADLSAQIQTTREFLADLSVRLEEVVKVQLATMTVEERRHDEPPAKDDA